jgi:hypothetical protein
MKLAVSGKDGRDGRDGRDVSLATFDEDVMIRRKSYGAEK